MEHSAGPFVPRPGIALPNLVGFLRRSGTLGRSVLVAVQHDKIESPTPFEQILREKIGGSPRSQDVHFITACTDSAREAYRRAREAREAYAAAGRRLTVVLGGPHAWAVPEEGTRFGHVDAVVAGQGEWAAAELLGDIKQNPASRSGAPFRYDGRRKTRGRDRRLLAVGERPHAILLREPPEPAAVPASRAEIV